MIKYILLCFFILFIIGINAQIAKIDSLENLLTQHIKEDTIKVDLLNQTAYQYRLNNPENTLKYAKEAKDLADKLDFKKGKSRSIRIIGIYYFMLGDYANALIYYKESLDLSEELGDKNGMSSCLNNIGVIHEYRGNYSQAIEYYQKTLVIKEEFDDKRGISACLNNIGNVHQNLDNYPEALEYHNKSLDIRREIEDKHGISAGLNNIGIIYKKQGNYILALEYYHKSLKIKEEIGDKKGRSISLNSIGNVHKSLGNYSQAFEYYKKSLQIKEELEDKNGVLSCLINIGLLYKIQGNYSQSLEYCQRSLKIGEEIGNKKRISLALNIIGGVYYKKANYPKALEYYQKSLKIREEIGVKSGICNSYYNIGKVYLKTHKYNKALEYTLNSLEIANELKLLDERKDIHEQLSKVYSATNNYQMAYENHLLYKELNDSIFNEENIKKIANLESSYEFDKEKQVIELEQHKKEAIHAHEVKQHKILRNSLIVGFILMIILVLLVLRSLLQKRKANRILTLHKNEIEDSKKELETTLIKLIETQSQLVKSEKMASIGILTAGVAHEINNPLNYIQGGGYGIECYIKENRNDSTELISMVEIIKTGTKKISKIVQSLNYFSRTSKFLNENCNIHIIIDDCLEMLKKQIKNRIEIKKQYFDNNYSYIGNKVTLHQALLNILTNAVQSINKKGIISINTFPENIDFIIKISDTGYGIEEENIKKISDPFFTTKEPGKGTGLGLSIAYYIIKEHNGFILFDSEINKGTTVTIKLPIHK